MGGHTQRLTPINTRMSSASNLNAFNTIFESRRKDKSGSNPKLGCRMRSQKDAKSECTGSCERCGGGGGERCGFILVLLKELKRCSSGSNMP